MSQTIETAPLTSKDFKSSVEPRWCPGCGDYSIYAQTLKVMPKLGVPKEKIVWVAGIGCSSRFPYYMNTYGFHGIHGRAAAIATGIKLSNPDLSVWMATGDGDSLSIGGNHFIHLFRRNIDINVILFNNRIYGLTKGQYSPTSERGKVTKSSPAGSIEHPFNPISLALAAGATFAARSIDRNPKHLESIIERAAAHKGSSFVEVLQNCNIFNDGAFADLTDKEKKEDNTVFLEDNKPLIYGKNKDKLLKYSCKNFESVDLDENDPQVKDPVFNSKEYDPSLAFALSRLTNDPELPTPLGVFRDVDLPLYETALLKQIDDSIERKGKGNLQELLASG